MSEADSPLSVGEQLFVAREMREYATGNLDNEGGHRDVRRHAVVVSDPDLEAALCLMEDAYEPLTDEMPTNFWVLDLPQKILKNEGTKTARKALEAGQYGVLDYMIGLVNYDPDISGANALMKLQRWISRTASMNIIAGHMGTGKTDMSLLLAQMWLHHMEVNKGVDPDQLRVLSNITTSEETETVTGQAQLVEELEKAGFKFVVIDEASSNFSASAGEGQKVIKQFKRTTRMIRKQNGYLVLIAHREDAKDIHKDIRLLSDIVYKTDEKRATIYAGRVEEGNEKMELSQIPQTDWQSYDTNEESDWNWDLEVGDDEDTSWDDFYGKCLFEKENGDRCGSEYGLNEYGFCHHHDDTEQAERVEESEEMLIEYMRAIATDDSESEEE